MNTKKIFSSAALAASLTLAAGAAFAWGCGAGSMLVTVPAVKSIRRVPIPAASMVPTG